MRCGRWRRAVRRWLSRVAVRRRLERILGTTLIGLGVDLAAATR
jgi:threonine/homoserine/homoserine lactone efflux protein